MRSYKIPMISINKFSDKEFSLFSFSARDYRRLLLKNANTIKLKDLLEKNYKVGKEIGSENYMNKSKHRFLKTVNISNNFLLEEISIEYCKPKNKVFPKKDEILIVKDGAGNGLGEVCLYPHENKDNLDGISAGIISIKVKEEQRYYLFGILKSQHFKDYIDLNTAQGSTIRHSKLIALDYEAPFPNTKNNPIPENVEKLVSLIVQNIIDKEEQIRSKNKLIDEKIEQEIRENQKENSFSYVYPKINEIKEEGRFDAGIYETEYKKYEFLLKNYGNDYYFLDPTKISPGVTPKDYHFSDSKRSIYFFDWVTPKNIGGRQLLFNTYIYTKTKSKVKKFSLVLNGIRYVGNGIFVEEGKTIYSNQNTLIVNEFEDKMKQLFLLCFLTSPIGKTMQMIRRNFGIVPILYTEHLCKIPIPYFPESKQKEIAKIYYNKRDKNNDLIFEDYLEKEKVRNKELGIFQLNTEIFRLREIFEDLVHKIVMEEKIEMALDY